MSMSQVVYMGPYLQFTLLHEASDLSEEITRLSRGKLDIVLGGDHHGKRDLITLIVANLKDYKKFGVQVLRQDDMGGPAYPQGSGWLTPTLRGEYGDEVSAIEERYGVSLIEERGVVLQWV